MTVLVGFATMHGSTRGVAERIASRLGERGIEAEVRSFDDVADGAGYDAFVLGSAVANMAWLAGAANFVHRNAGVLRTARVAVQRRIEGRPERPHRSLDEGALPAAEADRRLPGTDLPLRLPHLHRCHRSRPLPLRQPPGHEGAGGALRRLPELGQDRRLGGEDRQRPGGPAGRQVAGGQPDEFFLRFTVLSRAIWPDLASYSLDPLLDHAGIVLGDEQGQRHRARFRSRSSVMNAAR